MKYPTIDEIIEVIDKELQWCLDNTDRALTAEYRKGFTNGLIQAKYLIGQMAEVIKEPPLPTNQIKRDVWWQE